jgi:hypothetical protein
MIQDERDAGMSEEMIQQEFYCSFEAPLVGSYYGNQMMWLDNNHRITNVPWDPALPVHTAWDLGISDMTSIWFIQEYGHEIRIIDFYQNSGEALGHYVKVLKGEVDKCEHRMEYTYGKHYFPHDIEVREMATGKTRREVLKTLGLRCTLAGRHEVVDGIETVRAMLPMCWIDATKCDRGIEALRSYRKEWVEENKIFRTSPLHDWSSHPADALRIYAQGRKLRDKYAGKSRQAKATDGYDYLTGS